MKTPDVTPVQIAGSVPAAAALLQALGVLDLDPKRGRALSEAVRFGAALVLADAVVRHGRALGFGRHLGDMDQGRFPEPVIGDDADDDIEAIALDDESGEPILEDEAPPLAPAGQA